MFACLHDSDWKISADSSGLDDMDYYNLFICRPIKISLCRRNVRCLMSNHHMFHQEISRLPPLPHFAEYEFKDCPRWC
jgi:hypothetical protein